MPWLKVWAICIGFLLVFLVGGWHLGQVYGELCSTRIDLITTQNQNIAMQSYLAIQGNELLATKQELNRAKRELEQSKSDLKVDLKIAQPRRFNSLEELQAWLAEDDTNQMEYCNEFNCIDFALQLQERALADGYILSTEVLPVAYHWANIAVIGDVYYIIEPQDDRILLEVNICHQSNQ